MKPLNQKRNNECLIDFLRFSLPNVKLPDVVSILGLELSEFSAESLGSPFPNYDRKTCFANIEVHFSNKHEKALVNLSGQACRQYEEYMSRVEGWHWQAFIDSIIDSKAKVSRIDLALDIFDDSSPSVQKIQDYIKRGQLSAKSHKFVEINSGRISDGVLTGFTVYIGATPQILRIYDKKQERRDNTDEIVMVEKWTRWELELTDQKAMQVAQKIAYGRPLSGLIKGILAAHYSFKTQPKGKKEIHNKSRLPNMQWWDKFIGSVEKVPLRVVREKMTLSKKKKWIEKSTSKSLAMVYQTLESAYDKEIANAYFAELLETGTKKLTEVDRSMIEQRINELLNGDEY